MKKTAFYLLLILSLVYVTGCTPPVQHADPFYNVNDDFSIMRIPLINPIEAERLDGRSPWSLGLHNPLLIRLPKSQEQEVTALYGYSHVEELEKFAVKDGVILAYSAYVDLQANSYVLNNFYHWFVIIPNKDITKGFHTEEEFLEYIQALSIEDPDWQTPNEAYKQFRKTGCLAWIPDCEK